MRQTDRMSAYGDGSSRSTQHFNFYLDEGELFGLVDLFDFAIEGNIPTLYSAVAILFCSALLMLITPTNWYKPDGKHFYWLGLTVLFLFHAIDKGVAIHEVVGSYFERYLYAEGFLHIMWVVPCGIAANARDYIVHYETFNKLPKNIGRPDDGLDRRDANSRGRSAGYKFSLGACRSNVAPRCRFS